MIFAGILGGVQPVSKKIDLASSTISLLFHLATTRGPQTTPMPTFHNIGKQNDFCVIATQKFLNFLRQNV